MFYVSKNIKKEKIDYGVGRDTHCTKKKKDENT